MLISQTNTLVICAHVFLVVRFSSCRETKREFSLILADVNSISKHQATLEN